ncbi:MAG: hypothetical protein LBD99_05205, partial [Candidatus Margulisbacteria bacterium]|nr:hypothetical protein [Candidatus Margulisiibacteriota bacterium]
MSAEDSISAYIDPQQECLQKLLDRFEQETVLDGISPDELALKLFNFLKTEFVFLDSPDLTSEMARVTEMQAGNSQGLSLLFTNLLLAMSSKLGMPSVPNARVREAERDGVKQFVVIYEDETGTDRVFDFSDKIVDPLLQISLLNSVKDMLSINAYIPAKELELAVKYG